MLVVNFILPVEEDKLSERAILPEVLRNGCKAYPSLLSLNRRLADLYGARLSTGAERIGDRQVIRMGIRCLGNQFAFDGEDVLSSCGELILDCLLNPLLDENGLFDKTSVELEKANLIYEIKDEINDKRSYSLIRCREELLKGKKASLRLNGTLENASRVTPRGLKEAYDEMLSNARIEVMLAGKDEPKGLSQLFARGFQNIKRNKLDYQKEAYEEHIGEVKEIKETMDVAQAKLVLGMKLKNGEVDRIAMPAMVDLFGGDPTSLLFRNVREKLSLCYYCTARYTKETRAIYVDCGILPENKEKAQAEIMNQLQKVKNGEFSDEDLDNIKKSREAALDSALDSLTHIHKWYFARVANDDDLTLEEAKEKIKGLTREDIIACAKMVDLDTVFFLTGEDK